MTRFGRAQLVAFVRAIDRHLESRASILIVGGAAAAVAYHSDVNTSDIDVFNVVAGSSEAILKAGGEARIQTGLGIAIGGAAVAELPYNFEERIRPVRGLTLKRLTLLVPEKYDLVLSKTLRAYPHDIDAIAGIHRRHRLSRKTLVHRFETELVKVATGDPTKIRLNMAMVVARLYGFDEGRAFAETWGVPVPRRR